jgi:arsenite oxidase small subunit
MFMTKISRRTFIGGSAAMAALLSTPEWAIALITQPYPRVKITNIKDLKVGEPVSFNYPDEQSPAILVKLGERADGGVGPEGDIVAYSSLCTHMGCSVSYSKKRFVCACHYSMFDPAKNGQTFQGHASEWLPQIILRFEPRTGNIYAEGVEGLIWGRIRNILKSSKISKL